MVYTAETLADFMETTLQETGTELFGTDPSESAALVDAVAEVKAVLGVDDIADLTDDLKTRTVARWVAWRTARDAAAPQYGLKSGSSELKRSEFFEHLEEILYAAAAAASRYDEVAAALAAGYGTAYVMTQALAPSPYVYAACTE